MLRRQLGNLGTVRRLESTLSVVTDSLEIGSINEGTTPAARVEAHI
jgi:hypothetical protein